MVYKKNKNYLPFDLRYDVFTSDFNNMCFPDFGTADRVTRSSISNQIK